MGGTPFAWWRRRTPAALAVVALALPACASGDGADESPATTVAPSSDARATSTVPPDGDSGRGATGEDCDDAPIPAPREPGFEHASSRLAAQASPRHGITDALSVDGGPATIGGRFQYGRLRVDLGEERVELWLDDCSPNTRFLTSTTTDDDGVVEIDLGALDLAPGRYALHAVVAGDGTFASGVLTVIEGATEVTVFDIDGTLTIGDVELITEVIAEFFEELSGGRPPVPRAGAAEATLLHADHGRLIVYLTGRPVWLAEETREWLDAEGAASGVLRMPARDAGSLPTEAGVGATKRTELEALTEAGLLLGDAYGNASTDISAYRASGLNDDHIHVLGDEAPPGVDFLGTGFVEHNATLESGLP